MKLPQVVVESGIPSRSQMVNVQPGPGPGLDAMPQQLPIPEGRIPGAEAFTQSLAQTGNIIARMGGTTLDAYTRAAEKKQEAIDHAEGVERYQRARTAIETEIEALEQNYTPDYRMKVEKLLLDAEASSLKDVQSPRVQQYVRENLAKLRSDISVRATRFDNKQVIDRDRATFEQEVYSLKEDAKAVPTAEYETQLNAIFEKRRSFGMSATEVAKKKIEIHQDIAQGRADRAADDTPGTVLDEIRKGNGRYRTLDLESSTKLARRAEGRLVWLRSEQEHKDRVLAQETTKQAEAADGQWRETIAQNYASGTAKDLELDIIADRQRLGPKLNDILAYHRQRRQDFLKPDQELPSDEVTRIQVLSAIEQGRTDPKMLAKYSQRDLDRLRESRLLNRQDYDTFSAKRSAYLDGHMTGSAKKTDAEKLRDEETKDAAREIGSFLQRSSVYKDTDEYRKTGLIAEEAKTELHQRVAAEPNKKPHDIKEEIILRHIARVERLSQGLEYPNVAELYQAYNSGLISKRRYEFYYKIFEELERSKTGKVLKNPSSESKGQ